MRATLTHSVNLAFHGYWTLAIAAVYIAYRLSSVHTLLLSMDGYDSLDLWNEPWLECSCTKDTPCVCVWLYIWHKIRSASLSIPMSMRTLCTSQNTPSPHARQNGPNEFSSFFQRKLSFNFVHNSFFLFCFVFLCQRHAPKFSLHININRKKSLNKTESRKNSYTDTHTNTTERANGTHYERENIANHKSYSFFIFHIFLRWRWQRWQRRRLRLQLRLRRRLRANSAQMND